jgi:hypothetical protein
MISGSAAEMSLQLYVEPKHWSHSRNLGIFDIGANGDCWDISGDGIPEYEALFLFVDEFLSIQEPIRYDIFCCWHVLL